MRRQWTAKGNRDAGCSCSCDQGLHRYLRNFGGGGVWTPQTPLSVRHCEAVKWRLPGSHTTNAAQRAISQIHVFPSVRLFTEGMTYPQRCFTHSLLIQPDSLRVTRYEQATGVTYVKT